MRERKRINNRDWIPVTVAAKLLNVQPMSLYAAIHRGKLRVRVEQIQRLRIQLKDARTFLANRNPRNVETGKMAAAKRAEMKANGYIGRDITPPTRKMVNHPGRKPRPSTTIVLPTHTQTKIRKVVPHDVHLARNLVVSRDAGTESGPPGTLPE